LCARTLFSPSLLPKLTSLLFHFPLPPSLQSEKFCFDWFFKSRTSFELNKRGDTLIKLIEREEAEADGRKVSNEGGMERERILLDVYMEYILTLLFLFLFVLFLYSAALSQPEPP